MPNADWMQKSPIVIPNCGYRRIDDMAKEGRQAIEAVLSL